VWVSPDLRTVAESTPVRFASSQRPLGDDGCLGRELRATRLALGLTQATIADRLGVSPSYLAAVEAGRRNLTLGQLANIANAMRLGFRVSLIRPDGSPVLPGSRSPSAGD